jgi:hypothetical protein
VDIIEGLWLGLWGRIAAFPPGVKSPSLFHLRKRSVQTVEEQELRSLEGGIGDKPGFGPVLGSLSPFSSLFVFRPGSYANWPIRRGSTRLRIKPWSSEKRGLIFAYLDIAESGHFGPVVMP